MIILLVAAVFPRTAQTNKNHTRVPSNCPRIVSTEQTYNDARERESKIKTEYISIHIRLFWVECIQMKVQEENQIQ